VLTYIKELFCKEKDLFDLANRVPFDDRVDHEADMSDLVFLYGAGQVFPYAAIEEALANAVYHRAYDIREPIEVRIEKEMMKL